MRNRTPDPRQQELDFSPRKKRFETLSREEFIGFMRTLETLGGAKNGMGVLRLLVDMEFLEEQKEKEQWAAYVSSLLQAGKISHWEAKKNYDYQGEEHGKYFFHERFPVFIYALEQYFEFRYVEEQDIDQFDDNTPYQTILAQMIVRARKLMDEK